MRDIKNVTLEFHCPEKLSDKLFCDKCSHKIIDFTNKTEKELSKEIGKSSRPVCGLFKKSQLSDQFLKYAAATFIATSLIVPTLGQELQRNSLLKACEKIESESEDEVFLGVIIETQAEPIGGYKKFFDRIVSSTMYPAGLTEKGRCFVEFTIDTAGQMRDIKLLKGFNELADKEAVRVLFTLDYPFNPGRQRGRPVTSRLVIPIGFDPTTKEKK